MAKHRVAVSTNLKLVREFGIDPEVGGGMRVGVEGIQDGQAVCVCVRPARASGDSNGGATAAAVCHSALRLTPAAWSMCPL